MKAAIYFLYLLIGLLVMNFATYWYFYLMGNYNDKIKKIALIIGNIFIFVAWIYFAFFYK